MIYPRPSRSHNNCLKNRRDALFQNYNKGDTDAAIFILTLFILTLFQYFEKVAVVVRPQSHSFLGIQRCGITQSLSLKSRFRRRNEHPRGAKNILRIVVFGVYHTGDFLGGMHLSLQHRLEIQVTVRYVYGENTIRPEVAEIEIDRKSVV